MSPLPGDPIWYASFRSSEACKLLYPLLFFTSLLMEIMHSWCVSVYHLQQQAPKPKRIVAQQEVSIIHAEWDTTHSSIATVSKAKTKT